MELNTRRRFKMKDDNQVKVLFRYHSNVLEQETVETMWADTIDSEKGIYKLDSIPFYGPLIAIGDEFYAEYDNDEQMLSYRKTTEHSGNSIVLVSLMQEGLDKEVFRDEFKKLDCTSEGLNDTYFSMEIPVSVDYSQIKPILDSYEEKEIFGYAEPCLSEKHQKDIS